MPGILRWKGPFHKKFAELLTGAVGSEKQANRKDGPKCPLERQQERPGTRPPDPSPREAADEALPGRVQELREAPADAEEPREALELKPRAAPGRAARLRPHLNEDSLFLR